MKPRILFFFFFIALTSVFSCKTKEQTTAEAQTGVELWSLNCSRCHTIPDPTEYSDAQWEVVGVHMRQKANITAGEMDRIVDFLKTAN